MLACEGEHLFDASLGGQRFPARLVDCRRKYQGRCPIEGGHAFGRDGKHFLTPLAGLVGIAAYPQDPRSKRARKDHGITGIHQKVLGVRSLCIVQGDDLRKVRRRRDNLAKLRAGGPILQVTWPGDPVPPVPC